ncbi:t1pks [Curvularia kusanoi]|uniref:T1pks n=1 Tax=Curvularia kusanoi TaxID=90978 RepID=A0A9P4T3R9_CURKU|nr:t1pks [Curvularia kusanoi]
MDLPSVLLFGPQTKLPDKEQSHAVRAFLTKSPKLQKFLAAIKELSSVWEQLLLFDPALDRVPARSSISMITQWLEDESVSEFPSKNNSLCTPLTVIIQIVQYFQYLERLSLSHKQVTAAIATGGIQGFCTGILPALAISSSRDENEILSNAAVAVRLALCIGAYVDLNREVNASEMACIVVRCKAPASVESIPTLLQPWQDAFLSVVYDQDTVTVTARKCDLSQLEAFLSERDCSVRNVAIEGCFHSFLNKGALKQIETLCKASSLFDLRVASFLRVPVRTNVNGQHISEGSLSLVAASTLLTEVSDWHTTVSKTAQDIGYGANVTIFGLSDVIPPSVQRKWQLRVARAWRVSSEMSSKSISLYPPHAIAIVGMSAKYAGVDSLDDFWNLVASGKSMCTEVPPRRWSTERLRRSKPGSKFYGNFLHDLDAFDHKFFNKSSKEAAAMDPQQRLLLEASYQALESSGYFTESQPPEDIGCFIGVATTDYHDNITSHPPTAYSALGELRAFLCGRISYHFGWTGPSMTFDTACSASMVAIDAACRAIQTGQCARALAGGVSANTSPNLWDNLQAASFLSPTGPTKPFDERADGYCRGEGVGLVVLKSLAEAVRDDDFIMGVISATGVNQAKNETYITVPHGPSQAQLYKKVISDSAREPDDFSYVETHGTGTQKGDPAEMESLRKTFETPSRCDALRIGSVKGNIGHCEAASGVASVIKTVLMMQQGFIPPLANFQKLNSKISSLDAEKLSIPKTLIPWDSNSKVALINNYGAAGSNAALVLCQPPAAPRTPSNTSKLTRIPISISANSEESFAAYCRALRAWILHSPVASSPDFLPNLAYNLSRKENRALRLTCATTVSSVTELVEKLDDMKPGFTLRERPTILVFGGQNSDRVNLSLDVYHGVHEFRKHLDHCDRIIESAGYDSIFPAIFQDGPVSDIVVLHCMFLAIQYACAKTWISCGISPSAVIGHSFGQLTAYCISGVLSLADTVRLVAGRARLMQKYWGEEPGSMVAVDTNSTATHSIVDKLASDGFTAEIACYNGPSNHVLVGSCAAMDKVEQWCSLKSVRYKRLPVTNGFHSEFTEPLIPGLRELAQGLTINEANIPLETCSQGAAWDIVTPTLIADHTRAPVYFQDAVRRIESRFGQCSWLEAGSASSITSMVRRIATIGGSEHTFHPVKLNDKNALDNLADTICNLIPVCPQATFWAFNKSQHGQYCALNLPPYQFEKHRHWLDWKDHAHPPQDMVLPPPASTTPRLLECVRSDDREARFVISSQNDEFEAFVKGHEVLNQPLCPADLYIELVLRAVRQLFPQVISRVPSIEQLSIITPLGINPTQQLYLDLDRQTESSRWKFIFTSHSQANSQLAITHATGTIEIASRTSPTTLEAEFARYEQLLGQARAATLLADPEADGMRGPFIYKAFSKVVRYAHYYQGVQAIASKNNEVAARIFLPLASTSSADMVLDPALIDNFVQVAGIKVNCLNHCPPGQIFICGNIDKIQTRYGIFEKSESQSWHVTAYCTPVGDREYKNDIYVFTEHGTLAMIILGVQFKRVAIASLAKILANSNFSWPSSSQRLPPHSDGLSIPSIILPTAAGSSSSSSPSSSPFQRSGTSTPMTQDSDTILSRANIDVKCKTAKLVAEQLDMTAPVAVNTMLGDYGLDSLMAVELRAEVERAFDIRLAPDDISSAITLSELTSLVFQKIVPIDETIQPSTPAAITTSPEAPAGLEGRLAGIVREQLETTAALQSSTVLEDLCLDSLLSIELKSAIENACGVTLRSDAISPGITFDDLVKLVASQCKASSPPDTGASQQIPATGIKVSQKLVNVASNAKRRPGNRMKTILFHTTADRTQLYADIYLPDLSEADSTSSNPRSIALMIHGGGFSMLSRRDIRPKQTALLLANGFLPVSIDYRLCPEVSILESIQDVCTALKWAREDLPALDLSVPGLRISGEKVAVIGWSTGGTIALQLGFASLAAGIKPPDATLAFYCPSNFEDAFWTRPNFPKHADVHASSLGSSSINILEGVRDTPITQYNIDAKKAALGGWLAPSDARSRIVLHMNMAAQMLPIILHGLPSESAARAQGRAPADFVKLPQPSPEEVVSISPYSQIVRGNYHTPTFLIHGTEDDLIPCNQPKMVYEALRERGVDAGLRIVDGAEHLFDLYRPNGMEWDVVMDGYQFLFDRSR